MQKSRFPKLFISTILSTICLFFGCKDTETQPEELITTVKITFTEVGGAEKTFVWKDLDGAGGNNPVIDTIKIAPSKAYFTEVELLNESVSPVENIIDEVKNESTLHLFLYSPSDDNLIFSYNDTDANGGKLGIKMLASTFSPGGGKSLKITLKHQPNDKTNLTNPGGDTDVEAVFPVVIE